MYLSLKSFIAAGILLLSALPVLGCTSAIVAAKATADGRPLLWKHRDTSAIDNKVEYISSKDGEHSYVALFNASDRDCKEAWIGMNDVGFAVMNTASYNIKNDRVPDSKMDKEGFVMTVALKSCRTVDDFERLLNELPKPLGVEANFGVIDAVGNGAYFETNNDSFIKYDLADAPDGVLIRTNYSHSGREGEGYGHVRECNAQVLLKPYAETASITPEIFTEVLSRSFYRDVEQTDFSTTGQRWVKDADFIPRYKSTATVVIEGVSPETEPGDKPGLDYIMWTGMGYPPCAEIIPVWCSADGVDDALRGTEENGHSLQSDIVKKRRNEVFGSPRGGKPEYVDMNKLFNDSGTGYVQVLTRQNHETYEKFRRKRSDR